MLTLEQYTAREYREPPRDRATLLKLLAARQAGKSYRQAARDIGIHPSAVMKVMRRHNMKWKTGESYERDHEPIA